MKKNNSRSVRDAINRALEMIQPTEKSHSDWFKKYIDDHYERFHDDLILLNERVPKGSIVIDVGCAPMVFTVASALLNYKVIGIDLSPDRISFLEVEEKIDLRNCDIEKSDLPVEDSSADCIVLSEVFEHLRLNPPRFLRGLREKLKPNGIFILTTPNLYSARGINNFIKKGRAEVLCSKPHIEYQKLDTLGHMGHVREYTLEEIKETLYHCGFIVVDIKHREYIKKMRLVESLIVKIFPRFSSSVAFVCKPDPEYKA
jgi:SAM-dependent methyltransferase